MLDESYDEAIEWKIWIKGIKSIIRAVKWDSLQALKTVFQEMFWYYLTWSKDRHVIFFEDLQFSNILESFRKKNIGELRDTFKDINEDDVEQIGDSLNRIKEKVETLLGIKDLKDADIEKIRGVLKDLKEDDINWKTKKELTGRIDNVLGNLKLFSEELVNVINTSVEELNELENPFKILEVDKEKNRIKIEFTVGTCNYLHGFGYSQAEIERDKEGKPVKIKKWFNLWFDLDYMYDLFEKLKSIYNV